MLSRVGIHQANAFTALHLEFIYNSFDVEDNLPLKLRSISVSVSGTVTLKIHVKFTTKWVNYTRTTTYDLRSVTYTFHTCISKC